MVIFRTAAARTVIVTPKLLEASGETFSGFGRCFSAISATSADLSAGSRRWLRSGTPLPPRRQCTRRANQRYFSLPWGAPWPAGDVHDSPLSGRRARGTWRDRPLIHARRGILSEGPDAKSAGARDCPRRLQPDHRSGQAHADGPRTSGRRRLQHAGRRANRCTDRDSPSPHATPFAIRQSCCGCSHDDRTRSVAFLSRDEPESHSLVPMRER